jgi:hypothetical protein
MATVLYSFVKSLPFNIIGSIESPDRTGSSFRFLVWSCKLLSSG